MRRLTFSLGLLLASVVCSAQISWPTLEAPEGARVQVIAPDVILNGQRSRIVQVDAQGNTGKLLGHYRERFGARRVENQVGDAQVIATRSGEHFQTVQIRRNGLDGARATIVTTALSATPLRSAALKDTQSWLPVESAVQQTMESTDGGVRSVTVMASNTQSVQANRDLLMQAMQQRGLRLERSSQPDPQATAGREATALWLASSDEQVLVTVIDSGERRAVQIVRTREIKP
jgi:hypothetical protein